MRPTHHSSVSLRSFFFQPHPSFYFRSTHPCCNFPPPFCSLTQPHRLSLSLSQALFLYVSPALTLLLPRLSWEKLADKPVRTDMPSCSLSPFFISPSHFARSLRSRRPLWTRSVSPRCLSVPLFFIFHLFPPVWEER